MLIGLLIVLGIDLIVIVVFAATILSRRRWVRHRQGVFRGAIRVTAGNVDGVGAKWQRGYGRWVRDILVWTKAPLLFRNEIVPADGILDQGPAGPGKIKRLGANPTVIHLRVGAATVELAAAGDAIELLLGPYGEVSAAGCATTESPVTRLAVDK